ncbi:MAG TPA: DNRLRE domain-containing protein [Gaiellaceae bacterium]|nr:DNRLRE domain-containing protein [Gaiellaceae bacterium]
MRFLRPTPQRIAVLVAATIGVGAGAAYAASLSVGSWHLWAGSQALTKATCTLGASATTDTYVAQGSPGTSFGTNTTMLVRSNASSQDWSFIRFDLSSCNIPATGGADSATLTLTVTSAPGNSRTITVTPVLSTWSNTLTWTGAQSLSYGAATTTFATGTTTGTKTATVTVDVDNLIKSSTANFGWRLSDGGSGNQTTTFGTSQNGTAANRPQLVINYEK